MTDLRVGEGSDVHQLANGESLILGGVEIDSELGTVAHSDGDVLVHAVIDSILGACGWGDLGTVFPKDEVKSGASSLGMLDETMDQLRDRNVDIVNLDATVHCQSIRLTSYRDSIMKTCESCLLGNTQFNLKFKTGDEVGPVGRDQAIRANSIVLVNL